VGKKKSPLSEKRIPESRSKIPRAKSPVTSEFHVTPRRKKAQGNPSCTTEHTQENRPSVQSRSTTNMKLRQLDQGNMITALLASASSYRDRQPYKIFKKLFIRRTFLSSVWYSVEGVNSNGAQRS
jgi:hypothetical protein